MVQETYDTRPAIRQACAPSIVGHAATLEADVEAAMRERAMPPEWTAASLALHTQAVIQGAFILAKATGGAAVAADSIDHLRRYLKLLFNAERMEPAMPNTINLHRVFAAKPDKVYRAFLEADAVASWLPPYGFVCTVHELEARQGGRHRMSFRNFTTGDSHAFGGTYLKLVPGELLVYTDRFDDPNLPGEMKVTVKLKAVSVGTEVAIVQENVPEAIPVEACYLGCRDSLEKLARLVEPEIAQ